MSNATAIFDSNSNNWTPEPEYNQMFLKCQHNYLNNILRSRGHVFLNEVFDALGIKRTQAGCITGWLYTEKSLSFIDFGKCTVNPNGEIELDFNIDGIIYDKI